MLKEVQNIIELFDRTFRVGEIASKLQRGRVVFTGLKGSGKALFAASLFRRTKQLILFITSSNREAQELYNDLSIMMEQEHLFLFPSRETLPYDISEPYQEIVIRRILALNGLLQKKAGIYILPLRSFIDYFVPVQVFRENCIRLNKGQEFGIFKLQEILSNLGYERVDRVTSPGTYSLRGEIMDIYMYGCEAPFRLDFFDEIVESIRTFSPFTQRSIHEQEEVTILPAQEVIINPQVKEKLLHIQEKLKEVETDIQTEDDPEQPPLISHNQAINYLHSLYEKPSTVLEYTGKEGVFIFNSFFNCKKQADFFYKETERLYLEQKKERFLEPPEKMLASFEKLVSSIKSLGDITLLEKGEKSICEFKTGTEYSHYDMLNPVIDFEMLDRKGYGGHLKKFKQDIQNLLMDGYTVIVGASYEGQTGRLRELLGDIISKYERLKVLTLDIHEGFFSPRMKLFVILDREIFNRKRKYKRRFLKVSSTPLEGIMDVKEGDYVVHIEHGIGIYRGIHQLSTGNAEKDFVKIEYRDGDEIFIPVDQINLLQRYVGQEGRTPRIDKLGSDTWKRVKEHVKRSVKNLAKELLELYSTRAALKGHAFSRDTHWQFEFESGFRYEETQDQLRTIQEIKQDMENPRPMDRLVCGDVGFGKTEVAMRAAFKAVMDGKQVAVLVPTTVLAEQHVNTFKERFEFYPINVEMLSRFKTPREQRIIIENLKKGLIDVVVGTHRLLQKDVQFKDLGLVIIDEEQRFGVEHKEHFKKLRKLVDVITMTATPIPRTLYMSMSNIRDMSVMETPPQDRVPIETYVAEYNEEMVIEAIRREVERGGQIYYVHNRVKTIDEKAQILRKLMPDISFEVAHGRMDEKELEEIMKGFYDQEFQVLVTTTIIESGLDIPNVNTIIIERADRFGLSQLYQLRGRVGRSRRKAYAYLLYPSGKYITEKAEKRLSVINDYTHLSAGFSIAMKDLEIRGAGNILGREQHGDMLAVGFEMYVKLLDEAIRDLKEGEPAEPEIEPVIDIRYKGYIPGSYIESEKLRIEMYKRFAAVRGEDELEQLREELVDRFGPVPEELEELINVLKLKLLCREVGIKQLREKENELVLVFEKSRVDLITLVQKINKNRRIFSISPRDYNTLHIYRVFRDNIEKFDFLKDLFDYEKNTRARVHDKS